MSVNVADPSVQPFVWCMASRPPPAASAYQSSAGAPLRSPLDAGTVLHCFGPLIARRSSRSGFCRLRTAGRCRPHRVVRLNMQALRWVPCKHAELLYQEPPEIGYCYTSAGHPRRTSRKHRPFAFRLTMCWRQDVLGKTVSNLRLTWYRHVHLLCTSRCGSTLL